MQEKNANTSSHEGDSQSSNTENYGPSLNATEGLRSVKFSESTKNKVASTNISEGFVGIGQRISSVVGKTAEMTLLDEESLLACVVRTIPPGPGGRIRISETVSVSCHNTWSSLVLQSPIINTTDHGVISIIYVSALYNSVV